MYHYSTLQWVLFFYIYCFLGWVWESCYVSVKNGKWINRGFMHGPFLPIYGTGAIIILLATIPVKSSLLCVFFAGSFAATVLEFCTGEAMLRMFHVRYWDYSNRFLNIRGHICLKCSVVWGVFSVLIIRYVHVPIERFVCGIPDFLEEPITFFITLITVADFTISFREAMDFRRMLEHLAENNEELRHVMKRMEIVSAFVSDDMERLKDDISDRAEQTRELIELTKLELADRLELSHQQLEKKKQEFEKDKLENFKGDLEELSELLAKRKAQIHSQRMNLRDSLELKRVNSIMKRNNVAVSKQYEEVLMQMKEHFKKRLEDVEHGNK